MKPQIHQIHTDTQRQCWWLFLFDPALSNILYLCPVVWAKVNIAPSKTSHFPSHLLTTRGPKHTPTPSLLPPCLSPSLILSLTEESYMYMLVNYSLPIRKMQWLRNTEIIQGPGACDDPKTSGTIAVFYSPLILYAPCHTICGHDCFNIFLCPWISLFF